MSGQDRFDLQRFVDAQEHVWHRIAEELRAGCKTGHWMWFVFPQLRGLGFSAKAHYYGLSGAQEARAYLAHPLLGERLRWGVAVLASHAGELAPQQMLGSVDAHKLCSCLTLFASLGTDTLFDEALDALFGGARDSRTLALLAG